MGQRSRSKILRTVAILGLVLLPSVLCAYTHDKEKYYQIRSMEYDTWKFAPGSYYWLLHNKYSGAEMYWSWSLNKLGINYRFKEKDSDCKMVAPRRVAQIAEEHFTRDYLKTQIDSIRPLVVEETVRAVERNVDIYYSQYKDDFKELSQNISEGIIQALARSKGKLKDPCKRLQLEFDAVCSSIEYIHQQGLGCEIEPTKRQLAYEDAKERLTKLAKASFNLAYYASTLK